MFLLPTAYRVWLLHTVHFNEWQEDLNHVVHYLPDWRTCT